MKKYGLIIMLALCVVVGGVYATWSYAQQPVGDYNQDVNITIDQKTVSEAKGTFKIENNTLAIKMINSGNYNVAISITGSADIIFEPAAGADADVASGIAMQFKVTGPASCQYENDDIFTVTTSAQSLGTGLAAKIDHTDLEGLISLKNPITLDTAAKHTTFSNAISGKSFKITISEA